MLSNRSLSEDEPLVCGPVIGTTASFGPLVVGGPPQPVGNVASVSKCVVDGREVVIVLDPQGELAWGAGR